MILFAVLLSVFGGSLLFFQPSPNSLRASKLSFRENFHAVRGTFFLSTLLMVVFLITSDFKFLKTTETALLFLGLSNQSPPSLLWPIQFISHALVNYDIAHLVANLGGLGLTSLYERRVGTKRFLAVAAVSSLSSGLSIFFFESATITCGFSGGVCGLGACYFIDFADVRGNDLAKALMTLIVLFILFTIAQPSRLSSSIKVNHLGHIFGAIGGIFYCRFIRRPEQKSK